MRDDRRAPFVWQSLPALATIRDAFDGTQQATAIGVYVALTEVANEHRRREGSFTATRKYVAEKAGMSTSTLKRYTNAFEELGVLEVERREGDGGVNLPNVWTLVEPSTDDGGGSIHDPTPGSTHERGEGFTDDRHFKKDIGQEQPQEEDETVAAVWRYWLDRRQPKVTKLSDGTRRQVVRAVNAGFDVADLKRAIDGLLASSWHREKGKLQLSTIFTTGPGTQSFEDRIQSFIDKAPGAPHQPGNGLAIQPPLRAALLALRDYGRWEAGEWVTDNETVAQSARQASEELAARGLRAVWSGEGNRRLSIEEMR